MCGQVGWTRGSWCHPSSAWESPSAMMKPSDSCRGEYCTECTCRRCLPREPHTSLFTFLGGTCEVSKLEAIIYINSPNCIVCFYWIFGCLFGDAWKLVKLKCLHFAYSITSPIQADSVHEYLYTCLTVPQSSYLVQWLIFTPLGFSLARGGSIWVWW